MSTVTIVFGITTYFSEKKKYNKDVENERKITKLIWIINLKKLTKRLKHNVLV